jgi:hypothetical protein
MGEKERGFFVAERLAKAGERKRRYVSVPRPGFEPGTPRSKQGMIVPFHHRGVSRVETMGIEPIQSACRAVSPPWDMRPHITKVRPGIEPGLPPYHGGVRPQHLQTTAEGSWEGGRRQSAREPGLSLLPAADDPLSRMTEVGVEPTGTRLSTWSLCRFAYSAVSTSRLFSRARQECLAYPNNHGCR